MDYNKILEYRNRKTNTFINQLGIETLEIKEGYSKTILKIGEKHLNNNQSVHGGCIFTLADTTGSAASASCGHITVTVNANINYLSSARNTKYLIGEAFEVKRGRSILVYDVNIKNSDNKLIAKGSFTYYDTGEPITL